MSVIRDSLDACRTVEARGPSVKVRRLTASFLCAVLACSSCAAPDASLNRAVDAEKADPFGFVFGMLLVSAAIGSLGGLIARLNFDRVEEDRFQQVRAEWEIIEAGLSPGGAAAGRYRVRATCGLSYLTVARGFSLRLDPSLLWTSTGPARELGQRAIDAVGTQDALGLTLALDDACSLAFETQAEFLRGEGVETVSLRNFLARTSSEQAAQLLQRIGAGPDGEYGPTCKGFNPNRPDAKTPCVRIEDEYYSESWTCKVYPVCTLGNQIEGITCWNRRASDYNPVIPEVQVKCTCVEDSRKGNSYECYRLRSSSR